MFAELATLVLLHSEPARMRRGRVRRYRVEHTTRPEKPPAKEVVNEPPSEPRIHMITPIINPNLFRDRFGSWPTMKGDKVR